MEESIGQQTKRIAEQLLDTAALEKGQVLVVGCSTSEVAGEAIGSHSSMALAGEIVDSLLPLLAEREIALAAQCCEHLNRALIVERAVAQRYGWEPVWVVPQPKAGGSFATTVNGRMQQPVAVEHIRAHAGIDIGDTLIGMHLRDVAVPVRITPAVVGHARVVCARTRPKLIGGERAIYGE